MLERSSYKHTPGRETSRTSFRNCFVGYGELWDGDTVATVRMTPCSSRIRAQNMEQCFVRSVVLMKAHLKDSCRHCHVLNCFRSTASMQTALRRFPFFCQRKAFYSAMRLREKRKPFLTRPGKQPGRAGLCILRAVRPNTRNAYETIDVGSGLLWAAPARAPKSSS